jgi:hypothetical protein
LIGRPEKSNDILYITLLFICIPLAITLTWEKDIRKDIDQGFSIISNTTERLGTTPIIKDITARQFMPDIFLPEEPGMENV